MVNNIENERFGLQPAALLNEHQNRDAKVFCFLSSEHYQPDWNRRAQAGRSGAEKNARSNIDLERADRGCRMSSQAEPALEKKTFPRNMQLPRSCCVEPAMSNIRVSFLLSAALLGGCVAPAPMPLGVAGGPPSFAAFGEDEDACRREGTEAIQAGADAQDAGGPAAARRYDYAYQRCMFIHGRNRQMQAAARAAPPDASAERENLHSFDQPDAFYSVPYATPGYGYDGFSW